MPNKNERDEWNRERLREAVAKHADGSADKLGRMLGYKNGGFIRQVIDGKRQVRQSLIDRASHVPALHDLFQSATVVPIAGRKASRGIEIPRFSAGGAMGFGLVLRDQPGIINAWFVSPEWVEQNVKIHSGTGNLCIVTGFGDAMRPLFNPGDPLLVDRGVTKVESDAIYFFRVENEGFIKRLQRVPGTGILVISENKAYRDWVITKEMDFQVLGRVLKVWHGTDF